MDTPGQAATRVAATETQPRRRLTRSTDGRVVAGVASGISRHTGIDVTLVRVAFVLLAFIHFAGVVGYGALWLMAPQDDEVAADGSTPDEAEDAERRPAWLVPLLALGALGIGVVLLAQRIGFTGSGALTVPFLVIVVGVAVLWRAADDAQRSRWRAAANATASGASGRAWLRVLVGVLLVAIGLGSILALRGGFAAALYGLSALVVVALGAVAIAGPWLYRLLRDVRDERLERVREQERAELAAHVHDSVLQTLTLVQRHADDPREVVRLARAEERALRGWLYDPERSVAGTFGPSLERLAAEVEERHGGPVDVVVVGDAAVDERLGATLQASREAMVNAAKYASADGPVSVYAEVGDRDVSVFVRDRGPGFDIDAVPEDRHGLRDSVIGRMERHGGTATVRTGDGRGTEVELVMPREAT